MTPAAPDTPTSNDRAWALLFHEDTLFHQRLEIFLVAHTLLVAPVGFALSRPQPPHTFLVWLAVAGAVLGLVWAAVQIRSRKTIHSLEALVSHDPVYKQAYPHAATGGWRQATSQTSVLAVVLPVLVIVGWGGLAVALGLGAL